MTMWVLTVNVYRDHIMVRWEIQTSVRREITYNQPPCNTRQAVFASSCIRSIQIISLLMPEKKSYTLENWNDKTSYLVKKKCLPAFTLITFIFCTSTNFLEYFPPGGFNWNSAHSSAVTPWANTALFIFIICTGAEGSKIWHPMGHKPLLGSLQRHKAEKVLFIMASKLNSNSKTPKHFSASSTLLQHFEDQCELRRQLTIKEDTFFSISREYRRQSRRAKTFL